MPKKINVKQSRWVVKALSVYSDSDWREILECIDERPIKWYNEKPPCGHQTQMPLDPRTYCDKQYTFRQDTGITGCCEYWRPYKFVGQDGYLVVDGYSNMNLTYYPNRHTQRHRFGIKIVPCSGDGTATDDFSEKSKFGKFTEKEFKHWNKLVFTNGDTNGSPIYIPSCMNDTCNPIITGNFKIRIHFFRK